MKPKENGFEWGGDFFPWHVTDRGKDLVLIDRLTGLRPHEFFAALDDDYERGRGPIMLALIATSLRAARPSWSLERIARTVEDMSLNDVEFLIGGEEDEEDEKRPPEESVVEEATPELSAKSNGSSDDQSQTSSATSASSGSPGSGPPTP